MTTQPAAPRANSSSVDATQPKTQRTAAPEATAAWQQALDRVRPQPPRDAQHEEATLSNEWGPAEFASIQATPVTALTGQATAANLMGPAMDVAGGAALVAEADKGIGRAALAASLTGLAMPAGAEGAQHWQFSFSHAGSPLLGVALTSQPGAPWQMQLQVAAHARERTALDARLGDLRLRLAGRGAAVSDVTLAPVMGETDRRN